MAPWCPPEISRLYFGFRDIQFVKEDFRHVLVEMLAGMNQAFSNPVGEFVADGPGNSCRLDELGPSANYSDDLDHLPSVSITSVTMWSCSCCERSALIGRLMTRPAMASEDKTFPLTLLSAA